MDFEGLHKLTMIGAWNTVNWGRGRRLPDLKGVLSKIGEKRYVDGGFTQEAVVAAMKARFRGKPDGV